MVLDQTSEVWVKAKKGTPHREAVEKGTRVPLGEKFLAQHVSFLVLYCMPM